MKRTIVTIFALATFVLLISPAFALDINVSVDDRIVSPGENFTVSGTIAYPNGTTGVFTYRAGAVGPNRTFVCDSGTQQTSSNGIFSITCFAPNRTQAAELGIPAANTRAVIPLRAGVAVTNPETNETQKRHQTVLVVLKTELQSKLNSLINRLDSFIERATRAAVRCPEIPQERLRQFGINITVSCPNISQFVQNVTSKANELRQRAQLLSQNLTREGLEDLREEIKEFRQEQFREFKSGLAEVREIARTIRGGRR